MATKKKQILDFLAEGKKYEEIAKTVDCTLQYAREVAMGQRKRDEQDKLAAEAEEHQEESKESEMNNEMEFKDDLDEPKTNNDGDGMEDQKNDKGDPKTGKEYHEDWVAKKAYECSCGCTLNRKSKFCPNCGVILDWSGF